MKASARREARVRNVAFRIMAGNVELCGDKVQKTTGFLSTTLEQYSGRVREWRETAREVLGVGERPTVVHVAEGSPAHLAGLKAGDELLRLNGQALGTGKASGRKVSEIFGNSESEDFTLTIERRGEARELALGRAAACDYPVLIVNRYDVNAWADGERIYVTAGMLRFTENDEELAPINRARAGAQHAGPRRVKEGQRAPGGHIGSGCRRPVGRGRDEPRSADGRGCVFPGFRGGGGLSRRVSRRARRIRRPQGGVLLTAARRAAPGGDTSRGKRASLHGEALPGGGARRCGIREEAKERPAPSSR